MLEIIAIVLLCRKCMRTARAKGRSGGLFAFLAAVLWVGMEFLGVLAGAFMTGDLVSSYVFGLIGAVIGALVAWLIVKNLADRTPYREQSGSSEPIIPISQPSAWQHQPPVSQPAAPQPQARPQELRTCGKCGRQMPQDSRFCDRCGSPL